MKNSLLKTVKADRNGSARLLTLCLITTEHPSNLVGADAPTLTDTPETKDEFYESLASIIKNIPSSKQIAFLDDFNARVWQTTNLGPLVQGTVGLAR